MPGSFAERLAERIVAIGPDTLDANALAWTRSAAIDTIAVMLAGSTSEPARIARRVERPRGGEATVVGVAQRAPPATAAFLNGIAAHALEYDDYSHDVRGHPSALLFSALLAVAGTGTFSGLDLIAAYFAGFKTQAWLVRVMGTTHTERGWHVTTTAGAPAAAAACAHLLRLDPAQVATALSLATSLASGHRAGFGSMAKPLQLGHASRNGVTAALLAAEGFTANADAFEARQGFFEAYAEALDGSLPPSDWSSAPIDVTRSGFRLHPGCGALQAAAHAAIALHADGIGPDTIAAVEIVAEQEKFSQTDRPEPRGPHAAHFSIHYAVARGLVSGRLSAEDFSSAAVAEPAVAAVMRRIRLVANDDAMRSMGFGAEVRATLRDGTTRVAAVSGIPGMGQADIVASEPHRAKFRACAEPLIGARAAGELWRALARLETIDRLDAILALVAVAD